MYVPDASIDFQVFCFALIMTILGFIFPMTTRASTHRKTQAPAYGASTSHTQQGPPAGAPGEGVAENRVTPGMIGLYLRAFSFPLLAALGWFVLGYLSAQLNNCIDVFAACYTSPTFAATTGSTVGTAASYAWVLEFMYYGLGFFMLGVGIVMIVSLVFVGLVVEMAEGQKA